MKRQRTPGRPIPVVTRLLGRLEAPPSKSVTQRALVAASLANGRSRLLRPLLADDSLRMIEALRNIGIPISVQGEGLPASVEIEGGRDTEPPPDIRLDVGNAGTAMRFLCARMAGSGASVILDGDDRMRQRPIEDLLVALRHLGAAAESVGGNGCPPVRVGGRRLAGGPVSLPGARSSQYLSALLLAAPVMERGLDVQIEGHLVSRPYVDLTLGVMRRFGVAVVSKSGAGGAPLYSVGSHQSYLGADFEIEGDFSSASYFLAAAALVPGRVEVTGLNDDSLQGDARLLDLLEAMGCRVVRGPRSVILEGPERLHGVDADLRDLPDMAPTLAVVAMFADSPTRISGAPHLRLKESDRIAALCDAIGRLGGSADPQSDGLVINPHPLHGAAVDPRGDHRLAMAFAVAGLRVPGVVVLDPDCVAKSYPGFWRDLEALTTDK